MDATAVDLVGARSPLEGLRTEVYSLERLANANNAENIANQLNALHPQLESAVNRLHNYGGAMNVVKSYKTEADLGPLSGEVTWSVDQESNTITLDDGYRLRLNENRSEVFIERVDEDGNVTMTTRIWGDPHIDMGSNGSVDADFKHTMTFVLGNGTKITIGTRERNPDGPADIFEPDGVTFADTLTITRDHQVVKVKGLMSGEDALRYTDVGTYGRLEDRTTNDGFVVFEAENNNWKGEDGELISDQTGKREYVAWDNRIDNEVELGDYSTEFRGSYVDFLLEEGIVTLSDGIYFLAGTEVALTDSDGEISESKAALLLEAIENKAEEVVEESRAFAGELAVLLEAFADSLDEEDN